MRLLILNHCVGSQMTSPGCATKLHLLQKKEPDLNLERLLRHSLCNKNLPYIIFFCIQGTFDFKESLFKKIEKSKNWLLRCLINIPKGNDWILRIGLRGRCQRSSIILVIKLFKNWSYRKKSKTKNMLLNSYSSMKKKSERFRWFLA